MSHIRDGSFGQIGHIHESGTITHHGEHVGYAKEDGDHGEIWNKNRSKLLGRVDDKGHVTDKFGKPIGHLNKSTGEVVAHNRGTVGHVHHDDKLGAAALLLLMQQEKDDK